MDVFDEHLAEVLAVAVDATLDSIGVWPEPTTPRDAVKMLAERLADDLDIPFTMPAQRGLTHERS